MTRFLTKFHLQTHEVLLLEVQTQESALEHLQKHMNFEDNPRPKIHRLTFCSWTILGKTDQSKRLEYLSLVQRTIW